MSKARPRRTRQTDRPMALAIMLGALSALSVAVVYLVVEMMIPTSPIRTFFDLVTGNANSPIIGSDLYKSLLNDIDRQSALIADPIAYTVSGVVFGRTISRRYTQRQVFLGGGGMALALNLLVLSVLWGQRIVNQHGHLRAGEIDAQLALMQLLLVVLCIGLCLLGVEIGLRLRRAAQSRLEAKSSPAPTAR